MVKLHNQIFYIFFIAVIFHITNASSVIYAQDSMIEKVLQSNESLVMIKAITVHKKDSNSKMIVQSEKSEKQGAGVILDDSGHIVTNLHIIKYANEVEVELIGETIVKAKVLEIHPKYDLALLKIVPPNTLTPIELIDSDQVQMGDEVINVGNSFLWNNTISLGKITGLGTSKKYKSTELIQVNLPLNYGDSGGPLLNRQGRLVGMIRAKVRKKYRASLAIPSNKIKDLYLDYVE